MSLTTRVALALGIGLTTGIILDGVDPSLSQNAVMIAEPVGTLWLNGIRLTVVPLVVSLLIVSIASPQRTARIGRLGLYAIVFFTVTLVLVALFSAAITPLIFGR